jgi:isochorismate pyruvate lyase
MPAPEACPDMPTLRAEIDRIDRSLVMLLAERARYIDRAAAIKPAAGLPARIDERVAEVIAKVRAESCQHGLDADLAENLWRHMIEWSIAREETLMQGKGQ